MTQENAIIYIIYIPWGSHPIELNVFGFFGDRN